MVRANQEGGADDKVRIRKEMTRMKKIGPIISDTAAEFYPTLFPSLHFGATYVLNAFPRLYRRTLHDLRGIFSENELSLILESMNSAILSPHSAGYHIAGNVADGIALDHRDKKWQVDGQALSEKLAVLSPFQLACLELWANGFWCAKKQGSRDIKGWKNQLL